MPIYQYLCPRCNFKFELRQSFTDKCKVTCPKCNNGARRLFIPVPIIFKGSGFYVTDSAKKSEIQDSPKEAIKEAPKEPPKEAKVDKKEESSTPKAS